MKTIEFKSDIIAIHWLFNFSNSPKERARTRKDIFIKLLAENKGVKQLLKEFSELSGWFLDQGKTEWILTLPSQWFAWTLTEREEKSVFAPSEFSSAKMLSLRFWSTVCIGEQQSGRSSQGSSVKTEMIAIKQTIHMLSLANVIC